MKPVIIPFQQQPTTVWSGGQTTQLFIAPAGAVYSQRDFSIRISSATIEVPTSDFTPLPGYNRILMVLDGALEIEHQGHHSCFLKPYETDNFKGDWTTSAKGLATDFNIIHHPDVRAKLKAIRLDTGQVHSAPTSSQVVWYLFEGSGQVTKFDRTTIMNRLDTCYLGAFEPLQFEASSPSILIQAEFRL